MNGALVTAREFVSDFAKFKHVLVQEKFVCTIDNQTAAAKIPCSYGTQSFTDFSKFIIIIIIINLCRGFKSEDIVGLLTNMIIYNYRYCLGLQFFFVVVPEMENCGFSRLVVCFVCSMFRGKNSN